MPPVYTDELATDQVLDWDHSDPLVLQARKFGAANFGSGAFISYDFMTADELVDANGNGTERVLTQDEQDRLETYMQLIEDVTGVVFFQVDHSENAPAMLQLQARNEGIGNAPPTNIERDGDTNGLAPVAVTLRTGSDGTFSQGHALHEMMHALGLNHPGAYDGGSANASYDEDAHYAQDTKQYTLMSYFSATFTGANWDNEGSSTLMLHDVMALQKLYGANENAFFSDTTYGFGSNTNREPWTMESAGDHMFGAIWDTGGHDLINLSGLTGDSEVDLRQGSFSSSGAFVNNFSITYGTVIEDLRTGTGDDWLSGNGQANVLSGSGGDDTFYGRGGDDSIFGGSGNDTVFGGAGGDDIDGGTGRDASDYGAANGGMDIDLADGTAERLSGSSVDTLTSIEDVYGSEYGDVINGNGSANFLSGRRGDDVMRGRGYNDRLDGEQGDDSLFGGNGDDTVLGGAGNDYVSGGGGDDHLNGQGGVDTVDYSGSNADWDIDLRDGEATRTGISETVLQFENLLAGGGDDALYGTSDANTISGGDGDDLIYGRGGSDLLLGNDGHDTVFGGNGHDTVVGGNGHDSVTGGNGNDLLRGGNGNDFMRGNAGLDRFQGGAGRDTVTYSDAGGPWFIDLESGLALNSAGTSESLSSIENIIGSRGNDRILGDDGANNLQGERGNDSISGRNGNDVIHGDAGADTLSGGLGNDQIQGGDGVDDMNGGAGLDRIDYSYSNGGWVIDLDAETATSNSGTVESIRNFEHVFGANGNDTILGERGANNLQGLGGNDTIDGRDGNDVILGGGGNDVLRGGADDDLINGAGGTDMMDGGTGADTVDYSYSGSSWVIDLDASLATRTGGGSEVIRRFEHVIGGRNDDEIHGSDYGNILAGGRGGDSLYGRSGADRLEGGQDDDRLFGGTGRDNLFGGDGDDWFYGGEGADNHYGGAGRDVFIFTEASHSVGFDRDVIRADSRDIAFEDGLDLISLAGIDADVTQRGDQAFSWGGSGVGRVELRDSINGYTVVEGFTGGSRAADFVLLIEDGDRLASSYSVTDFIL